MWRLNPRGLPVFHKTAQTRFSQQATCLRIHMETFGVPPTATRTTEHAKPCHVIMIIMMIMMKMMMTLRASKLWVPITHWRSVISLGSKRFETRSVIKMIVMTLLTILMMMTLRASKFWDPKKTILILGVISERSHKYRVRHKSINTPLSHERLVGGLQDGGRGTHVTHFVELYSRHYILRARCVRHAVRGMKAC